MQCFLTTCSLGDSKYFKKYEQNSKERTSCLEVGEVKIQGLVKGRVQRTEHFASESVEARKWQLAK